MTRPPSLWVDREQPDEAEGGPFTSARWNRQIAEARARAAKPDAAPELPPAPPSRTPLLRRLAVAAVCMAAFVALALSLVALLDDDSGDLVADNGRPLSATEAGKVYEAAGPGVVSVQTNLGSGTGFVVRDDGTIVTNAHVVGSAESARVRFGDDGRLVEAVVLGTDPSSDLAVLRVDPGRVDRLQPLKLADSDKVRVGDAVVAIGHPFGLDRTATAGIVSGLGRRIEAPDGFAIEDAIQTDAPINPGNSGGPLLDARGRVIGVNSQIASTTGGNVGIGFAVSSNVLREVLPPLSRGERIKRPYLGVTTSPHPGGARVQEVAPGGPADRAGLKAGDVITSVDGRPVRDPEDVVDTVAAGKPGERMELEVERDGLERSIEVELGTRPSP